jgi:hypothetical protein
MRISGKTGIRIIPATAGQRSMTERKKTAKELQKLIQQRAASIGPWPRNMSILVYPLNDSWRAVVGYSDVAQTPFRDKVIALSIELSELYDLAE